VHSGQEEFIKEFFGDKVAIVTGGASGIGKSLCEELGELGTIVAIADINLVGAKKVENDIKAKGGRAIAIHLDVTKEESMRQVICDIISEYGKLDYMVNNAGIAMIGEVRDTSLENWQRIIDINLMGVIYGTTIAYKKMIEQGNGHIVNISSISGLVDYPTLTPYTTTKHAVVGLSTSLRSEAAGLGVKVSVVCPETVKTGIWASITMLNVNPKEYFSQAPGRIMDSETAARMILKGVYHNKAIIVFPLHARFLWWLNRFQPGIRAVSGRKNVRKFRVLRKNNQD